MLKGLLTRQIFMFVDLGLAVLTVFVAYQVFTKLFQPPSQSVVSSVAGEVAPPTLPTVGPRDNYQVIVASRLFGPAGEARVEAPPPPPPPTTTPTTEFATLKLKGTSFTKVRPNALIEQQALGARVYQPGDEIIAGQVKLDEVHNRWVYLFNIQKNRREVLRMDEEDMTMASADEPEIRGPGARRRGGDAPDPSRNSTTIKRDELQQELQTLTDQLPDIIATANPHPVTDSSGKVVGFTADDISNIPLAKRLGFQNKDVVKEINGMPIDSMDSITTAIEKFQNANNFHVTVVRNGTPTLLRFKLE